MKQKHGQVFQHPLGTESSLHLQYFFNDKKKKQSAVTNNSFNYDVDMTMQS